MNHRQRCWILPLLGCSLWARLLCADFQATQTAFLEIDGKNRVLLEWTDSAASPGDVDVKDGSVTLTTIAGVPGSNSHALEDVSSGDHVYSVERGGVSLGSQEQAVLDSPQDLMGAPDPSKLHCAAEESGEDCEIVIDWETGAPPPSYYEVSLDGELHFVTASAFPTSLRFVVEANGSHLVALQPVLVNDSPPHRGRYQRAAIDCTLEVPCGVAPANRFVRGLCNQKVAKVDISSAIFGLSYLFLGGPAPGCLEACDANASGLPGERFDLSDMVFVLSFLFGGGNAPPSWGGPEASCEAALALDDCQESHAACAQ